MQKHVRIVLSILQNFLAISVDRILSALKTTQLFETEIVWKYVLISVQKSGYFQEKWLIKLNVLKLAARVLGSCMDLPCLHHA